MKKIKWLTCIEKRRVVLAMTQVRKLKGEARTWVGCGMWWVWDNKRSPSWKLKCKNETCVNDCSYEDFFCVIYSANICQASVTISMIKLWRQKWTKGRKLTFIRHLSTWQATIMFCYSPVLGCFEFFQSDSTVSAMSKSVLFQLYPSSSLFSQFSYALIMKWNAYVKIPLT